MDQNFINWILAGFGGLTGFLLHAVWAAVKDLQIADKQLADEVSGIQILVAGDYVKKSELSELNRALFLKLDRIEEKIDRKVDK